MRGDEVATRLFHSFASFKLIYCNNTISEY